MQRLALKSGQAVKYNVEVSPVREVTLIGAADLIYWQKRLDCEVLTAANVDGQAQLLIIAASMRFAGISFREMSISVVLAHPLADVAQDAVFLACAFNSVGLFAFVERTWFKTPYYRGEVDITVDGPAGFSVDDGHGGVLIAGMSPDDFGARVPLLNQYHGWEGPIFLPSLTSGGPGPKLFFGKLGGHTQTYAFSTEIDEVWMRPSRRHAAFQELIDSHFVGKEWIVRKSATHAKSKTMPRHAVELQMIPV